MGRRKRTFDAILDDLILNCLEQKTFRTLTQLQADIAAATKERGIPNWADSTIYNHVKALSEIGKVRHQESGYIIDRGWKEGQPKAFILVEIVKPKETGVNNPKTLLDNIRTECLHGKQTGINLISVDVVMGTQFFLGRSSLCGRPSLHWSICKRIFTARIH